MNLYLQVTNPGASGIIALDTDQVPEGWEQPVLRGGGFRINQVYVKSGENARITLDVKIPGNASAGAYTVTVRASGNAGAAELPLTLRVSEPNQAGAALTSQYPALRGPADATYSFQVTLDNDGNAKETFSLAAQAPQGWEVKFKPRYEDKHVVTIPVDPNSTQSLDVEVRVPRGAAAGSFKIPVRAASGSATAEIELQIELIGTYALNVTTPSGLMSAQATAGRESSVTISVANTGSAPLTDVSLTASAPPNWTVTFAPDKVDALAPGETKQVQAVLKPSSKAIAGDYVVSVWAQGRETSDDAEFRVAVRTSTLWGFIGVGLVLLVIAGVSRVFKVYGRR
ncbi:MAG: alpha-galactosidase [Firmicutes bacterium]|nr:alpha-galactosidase [Bacillota bacterium]